MNTFKRPLRTIKCSSKNCWNCPFSNETEYGRICNLNNDWGDVFKVYRIKKETLKKLRVIDRMAKG